MKVIVNRTPIELFEGAKVRHALLNYCVRRRISKTLPERGHVFDAYGHEIDLDAPLHEGQTIKFLR